MLMPSGKVNLSLFFGTLLWMSSFSSCSPKLETIPYAPVNLYFSIIPTLANVGILESYVVNGVGARGIIIFHKDVDVWEAYDMACMYRPRSEPCTIKLDSTGILPKCPCCKSVYNLINEGFPQNGPAQQGLHPYYVTLGNNFIQITN
jgi:hypothetical protein